jgi:hypothetical protein
VDDRLIARAWRNLLESTMTREAAQIDRLIGSDRVCAVKRALTDAESVVDCVDWG